MDLDCLPAELKLLITDFLNPLDCFAFAITNRDHYELCSALITTHRNNSQRYNRVFPNSRESTWEITKEIVRNPKLAQYVKEAFFRSRVLQPSERTFKTQWVEHFGDSSTEILELFADAANRAPLMREVLEETGDDMEQALSFEGDEAAITLLISVASNLRTLAFAECGSLETVQTILYQTAISASDPTKAPFLPFQHLTTLAVSYGIEDEGHCSPLWMEYGLNIPSLRKFATERMGGSAQAPWEEQGFTLPKSNVKEIVCQYSYFAPEQLEKALGMTTALESFLYSCGDTTVSEDGSFAPRRVTAALLKNAAHSLKTLTFIDATNDSYASDLDIDHVSLRGFQKLTTLRCSWDMLFGQVEDSDDDAPLPDGKFYTTELYKNKIPLNITERLPLSLERLHLDDAPNDDHIGWTALIHLIRNNNLPNLETLYVIRHPGHDFRDAMKEKGIRFKSLSELTSPGRNPLSTLLGDLN